AAEARVDRVDDQQRAALVAAAPQRLEEAVGRHARAGAALHRLDDHAGGVTGEQAGILTERPAVYGAGQPRREGLAEALEARRREREQPGAVVRAVEGDDAGTTGRQQ